MARVFAPTGKAPKPCPTCYAPMVLVKGEYSCARHGASGSHERAAPQTKPTPSPKPAEITLSYQSKMNKKQAQFILSRCRGGEFVSHIANEIWEELGYKNARSCAAAIYKLLST